MYLLSNSKGTMLGSFEITVKFSTMKQSKLKQVNNQLNDHFILSLYFIQDGL